MMFCRFQFRSDCMNTWKSFSSIAKLYLIFNMHWHSSVIFCKVMLGTCFILFYIRERMSLSRLAINSWAKARHLNMSMNKSFKLNLSHCWFTFPAKLTKSSSICFLKFKHLYLLWNYLFLSPKILDKIVIVSSNEIFCILRILVSAKFLKQKTFCSSDQEAHRFEKKKMVSNLRLNAGNIFPSRLYLNSEIEFTIS